VSPAPILPGSAVGVLGSGQLGRMFALAARRMGYRVHTFSPDSDTPTGQVADVEVSASYEDTDALKKFAAGVDVVTFEFENVPAKAVETLEALKPVRPRGEVLHITQHRLREKTYLSKKGFPVTPYRAVATLEELRAGLKAFGTPAVLKTAGFGYDGKGQSVVRAETDAAAAFAALKGAEGILEAFVDFECEFSVVAARALNGATAHFGVVQNSHKNHVLDLSVAPAALPPDMANLAVEIAQEVLKALDVVGVLCVEFFLTKSGKVLINELAPRPHNSGHLTLDACVTSQFEQQLRAVCGLPLGDPAYLAPGAAMANLLGDLWADGEPAWPRSLLLPEVKLHLYGKSAARPGRKMGHLTALGPTPEAAAQRVIDARRSLQKA
jgi:5-(carboxyamino)imidazole ribonucleotide synthase